MGAPSPCSRTSLPYKWTVSPVPVCKGSAWWRCQAARKGGECMQTSLPLTVAGRPAEGPPVFAEGRRAGSGEVGAAGWLDAPPRWSPGLGLPRAATRASSVRVYSQALSRRPPRSWEQRRRGPMSSSAAATHSPAHSMLLRLVPGTRPKAGWGTWLPSEELTRTLSCSAGSQRPEPREGPPPGVSGAACDWRTQRERAAGGGRRLSQGHRGGCLVGLPGGSSALLPHWKHRGPACSSWDPRMLISEGLRPFHSE